MAELVKTLVPISFSKGVDTKTDPKQVVLGKLKTLENATFNELMEFRKRNGFDPIGATVVTGQTIGQGTGVYAYFDELLRTDTTSLYTYLESTDNNARVGDYRPVDVRFNSISTDNSDLTSPQIAYHPTINYKIIIYAKNVLYFAGEVFQYVLGFSYKIIDNTTQAMVKEGDLNLYGRARVECVGNYFVIVGSSQSNPSGATLAYQYIDLSTPTVVSSQTAISSMYPELQDSTVIGTRAYFSALDISGDHLSAFYIDSSLTVSTSINVSGTGNVAPLSSLAADASNQLWITYWSQTNSNIAHKVYNAALTSTVFSNTDLTSLDDVASLATACYPTNQAHLFYSRNNDPQEATDGMYHATLTLVAGAVTPTKITNRFITPNSRAFVRGTEGFLMVSYNPDAATVQPTNFIINDSGKVIAKVMPFIAYSAPNKPMLSTFVQYSADLYEFATSFSFQAIASYSQVLYYTPILTNGVIGVSTSVVEFNHKNMSSSLAKNLAITGGYNYTYDADAIVEQGFHLFPEYVNVFVASGPTGDLAAGTYGVSLVYSWIDEKGQVQRSAPSPGKSITLSANQVIGIETPQLSLTSKVGTNTSVLIELYVTKTDQSTYYLTKRSVINVPTDNLVNITFGNQSDYLDFLLYTTGGVVENISAPASNIIFSFKNRQVVIPSEQPNTWWYSKQVIPGSPVEFSDLFVNNVDATGGPITAAGAMDDKAVFFKATSMYYVVGDGPSETGQNNTFTEAQLITTDGGCNEPKSVVTTPAGLMYKSRKGIYLIDRSLSVKFIGADVADYNNIEITSAQLLERTNRVLFTLANGTFLAYDYFVGEWGVWTNLDAVGSCIHEEAMTYIDADGAVYKQNPTSYTDAGEFIRMKIVTSWLSFSQLQGFQRVYKFLILGEYASPHTLNVSLAYEFDDATTQTIDIPVLSAILPYQFRVFPQKQKCETMQITIQDSQDSPFGEGYAISSLMLEVGQKKGTFKLPASRSYG